MTCPYCQFYNTKEPAGEFGHPIEGEFESGAKFKEGDKIKLLSSNADLNKSAGNQGIVKSTNAAANWKDGSVSFTYKIHVLLPEYPESYYTIQALESELEAIDGEEKDTK